MKRFYRKLFAMGSFVLSNFANLLEAEINSVGFSAFRTGRAYISPEILEKMEEHRKFICEDVLPLRRMLEFFQQIKGKDNHTMRSFVLKVITINGVLCINADMPSGNNRRLSGNAFRAAQASAMRRKFEAHASAMKMKLQALREKVKSLPKWLELLNGFEKVKNATEVQNFLEELEKVVGEQQFPEFLHHLSEFIHCSKSEEMTNTVRGAILELCDHFVRKQLTQLADTGRSMFATLCLVSEIKQ